MVAGRKKVKEFFDDFWLKIQIRTENRRKKKDIKRKKKGFDLIDLADRIEPDELLAESARREIYYSAYLRDIIKSSRQTEKLKTSFFWLSFIVLACIIASGIGIIYIIAMKDTISFADVGVAFTGFGTVLTAVLALLTIIAKHLFPENGESERYSFIDSAHQYDCFTGNEDLDEEDD